MEFFKVTGGERLSGSLQPQGAKNEALQIISAALLTDQPVTVHNVPDILDVRRLIEFLANLGARVERLGPETYRFTCADLDPDYLLTPAARREAQRLRGSIMVLGPLLARFGRAYLSKPGGDKIGRRRVDVHIEGLMALGATMDYEADDEFYKLHAPNGLAGTYMLLEEASVTGTANIVMAAVLARGTTTVFNAACEPYVQQLCQLLTAMGAKIAGVGSNRLVITGVESLGGAQHTLLADMIEVGSFIALAAMTQSELVIPNAGVAHLGLIPRTFQKLGVSLEVRQDDIHVFGQEPCVIETSLDGGILTLADHTWPGLTPDLLSVLLVTATQCHGTALIHQKMFESRLFFVDKLIDMGAQIILCDPHRATVIGLGRRQPLRGISMTSPDIRAGVALLIAALSAQGTSRIFNIEQIDRGYAHIDRRLNALGARIERLEE
jgi:UDP-N-acetylglucosamine 1-carboxyvinyltransferase